MAKMSKIKRFGLALLGGLGAVVFLVALAEGFLRLFPPKDLHPFLADEAPLQGIYKADAEFAVAYVDWRTFRERYYRRLEPYLPYMDCPNPPKIWAFFGNSFVQANGMLADHARAEVSDRIIFKLGENEPAPVRFAQVKLLLENGLKPERIIMSFLPVDTLRLGKFPLRTHYITKTGALTFKPRLPDGPARPIVKHSRIAFTSWVRCNMHQGNMRYSAKNSYGSIDAQLLADLERLFGNTARITRQHRVPLTVVLIPEYYQTARGAGFAFQDDLRRLLTRLEIDFLDPRDAFLQHPDPRSLYLPDKHLNADGNRLLLRELLDHLDYLPPRALARNRLK